jgi:hypothetical protein
MQPASPPLPTPRALLTSILNSLPAAAPTTQTNPPCNPLHTLSSAHKSLLTTLHVLFPPPTLLQALDLLDRGLVTRIVCAQSPDSSTPSPTTAAPAVYLVRSSQPRPRFSSAGPAYAVRLEAWNCSCAAFAFVAFPGTGSARDSRDENALGNAGWVVGGRSLGRDVPVCKHLLACVLAERWEGVVGGYVKERKVGREEMAGIGAG